MSIIHHNTILSDTINTLNDILNKKDGTDVYIVQNVYGKILIYVDTGECNLISYIKDKLSEKIGEWLNTCEAYGENFFVKSEIELWKKESKPVYKHIWVFERYLTNVYWDGRKRSPHSKDIKSRLISFYSFKGGVGRTTTLMMTALDLARQGKRIAVVDFDLEAPGVSSLFPEEALSQYGLLDFLLETNVYDSEINIDEYIYPVSEYCNTNQMGGEIYIMPAYGKIIKADTNLYRKNLMRFDLNAPKYGQENSPIDLLLLKLDTFLKPDFIFIDTRSGLHQIGGMALTRYSDMALLFFYGSQQNIDGMKMILPVLKKSNSPFLLVNSKVPMNEELAQIERKTYIEGAYEALCLCDERYNNGEILPDDETAEHYPIDIAYNMGLEVLNSTSQLLKVFDDQRSEYSSLSNILNDTLLADTDTNDSAINNLTLQKQIIGAFSDVMHGLETAAAEDEFATEQDLKNNFYPLRGYTFIFDPRKFLVLGQKGVGKTALFSALKNNNYAKALAKYLNVNTEQYEHTEWVVGTSRTTNYIDIFGCLKTEEQIRAFLYYKTIDTLLKNDPTLNEIIVESRSSLSFSKPLESEDCKMLTGEVAYFLSELLKRINQKYQKENKLITIIYDALDRIVASKDRTRFVSALINMWYMNESTLPNIRSKIFIRKDIYDREVVVADKVKLKNYSATIGWEYDQLFAMVWKRAISKSDHVIELYEKQTYQRVIDTPGLGYIPNVNEQENRAMLSALIGVKMGNGNKASTYNWFRNRLADTQGIIVPRSMLDIFAKAAGKELELRNNKIAGATKSIIRPKCFEDVLPEVSKKRVIDLKEEFIEYANFLESLSDTVQRSPVEEKILSAALAGAGFENPREEILNLINIGIIRQYQRKLSDPVRYHFPDIYLRGLGFQRAGQR